MDTRTKLPASIQAPLFAVALFPALARIYVELNHTRQQAERIGFDDAELRRWFLRLAGFDPAAANWGDPHAETAEALERALWRADEVEQLDGGPALSFAGGWMACRARGLLKLPADRTSSEVAAAAGLWDGHVEAFLAGWDAWQSETERRARSAPLEDACQP